MKILPHTHSSNSMALIAKWLQRCIHEHPTYKPDESSNRTLPTRLLDLEDRDKTSSIRLTETESLGEASPYLTLSHCWGGQTSLALKTDNVDSLKQGVDMSKLPLTFQHAIECSTLAFFISNIVSRIRILRPFLHSDNMKYRICNCCPYKSCDLAIFALQR